MSGQSSRRRDCLRCSARTKEVSNEEITMMAEGIFSWKGDGTLGPRCAEIKQSERIKEGPAAVDWT